jgi:hypothetical protein
VARDFTSEKMNADFQQEQMELTERISLLPPRPPVQFLKTTTMKTIHSQNLITAALGGALALSNANAQTAAYVPDRTVLPLAEPTYPPITEIDARKATPPPRFEPTAPKGAPNVVVILLDNVGYGATRPFGGVINMPTLQRLAQSGLIYNNFHTAPLCAPSRVALLTGRNPHSANMGSVAEISRRFRARPRNGP